MSDPPRKKPSNEPIKEIVMQEQDRLAMEQDNAPTEEECNAERRRQAEAGDASGHCGCGNTWRFVEEKIAGKCFVCVSSLIRRGKIGG